jgi:alpha-L-rhamnosidase
LAQGATFTWESWDARQVGDSESHGWGATVLSVLQDDILGARVTAPGGAEITVDVPETSMTNAAGVVSTQRGPVAISWTVNRAEETIDVTIPANVNATVHLAGPAVENANEGRRPLTADPGVTSAREVRGETIITVGSGHYHFANTRPTVFPAAVSATTASSHTVLFVGIALAVVAAGLLLFAIVRRRRAA